MICRFSELRAFAISEPHKATNNDTPTETPRWVRWAVAVLAGGLAFGSYVERMNISIAAERMMPDLSLSKIEMGHVFSSFLLGYAIFQVPAGKVGDVVGARITLAFAAIIWGITTILTGLLPNRLVAGTGAILASLL